MGDDPHIVAGVICDTDRLATPRHAPPTSSAPYWRQLMRMPILSYFLVVGTILFGVLVLVSNQIEPKPPQVSQTVVQRRSKRRQNRRNRE